MVGSLKRLIPKGRLLRSTVALAGGTAAAQIVAVCAMPAVTRLYTPAEVGVLSLFVSFIAFWTSILSWRYEFALVVAEDDDESHAIYRVAIGCVIVTALLALPALLLLREGGVLGFNLLPRWASFISVPILLGIGLFMIYRAWALRIAAVKSIAKATLVRSAAKAIAQVAIGILSGGVYGLLVAECIGAWGSVVALMRDVRRRPSSLASARLSWRDVKRVMTKYRKFPTYELPSVGLNQLAMALPIPMIASLYGAEAAGWYGLARMMVGIPNSQIGAAVSDVFFMEFADAVRKGNFSAARGLFYTLLKKLSIFGLAPMAAIVMVAPWVVPVVFGSAWAETGFVAACLAPWLYAGLVVSSLSRLLSVVQAQEYKLVYDVFVLTLMAAVFVVSKWLSCGFIVTVLGFVCAGVLAYGLYLAVLVFVVEKRMTSNSHFHDASSRYA